VTEEEGRGNSIAIVSVPKDGQIVESDEEEFGLTEREEFDLEKVLSRADSAVVNAEAFMEQLAKELSILDGVSTLRKYVYDVIHINGALLLVIRKTYTVSWNRKIK